MKNLQIKQLDEKDELNSGTIISSGMSISPHPQVSIKHSMESDWISASESLLE